MKTCRRCKQEHPSANFTHDKYMKDGLCLYCRDCISAGRKYGKDAEKARTAVVLRKAEWVQLEGRGLRRCARCKQVKPLDGFGLNNMREDGLNTTCKICIAEYSRIRSRNRKELVIDKYGGACDCCGENMLEFLSIHHVNGDGGEHRQSLGRRWSALTDWLLKNDFPDGFAVLCHNCHSAISHNGSCPHAKLPKT